MRTNEEFTKAVYERRDDFLVKRKKKRKKIAAAVSPLIICIVFFSAFVVQDWWGNSRSLGEKAALRSPGAPEELLTSEGEKSMADGLISPVQKGENDPDVRWEDFYLAEDGGDLYDAISVRAVNVIEVIKDGEDKDSQHAEYEIRLTRGDETMVFMMAGDELYYNGEYCRKLDEAEMEYLLSLVE